MTEEKLENKPKEEKQEESKVEKLSEEVLDAVGGGEPGVSGRVFDNDSTKPEPFRKA